MTYPSLFRETSRAGGNLRSELKGSSNEEARAYAKSAVRLALALSTRGWRISESLHCALKGLGQW
jgi:hypothetical protein